MRRITYSILSVLASLALVSPLYAEGEWSHQARGTTFYQNTELEGGNTDEISRETKIGITGLSENKSGNELLGKTVVASDGENIGEIADFKVDTLTGRIDYVVVEKEDALGVGESAFIPVPLGALQISEGDARLTVDKARLDNVPNPGNMSDREFQQNLNTHYGIGPTWEIERKTTIEEERRTLTPQR
jgi:sporulation protein YlmC with PRC-barrel domain